MKVYAIASPHPVRLEEMKLYLHEISAEAAAAKLGADSSVVEVEVDEYPAIEELRMWLNTLTNPENLPGIEAAFKRAEKYGLEYEIILSAFNRQDEPDFEIVEQLHEACYRWDV